MDKLRTLTMTETIERIITQEFFVSCDDCGEEMHSKIERDSNNGGIYLSVESCTECDDTKSETSFLHGRAKEGSVLTGLDEKDLYSEMVEIGYGSEEE